MKNQDKVRVIDGVYKGREGTIVEPGIVIPGREDPFWMVALGHGEIEQITESHLEIIEG